MVVMQCKPAEARLKEGNHSILAFLDQSRPLRLLDFPKTATVMRKRQCEMP